VPPSPHSEKTLHPLRIFRFDGAHPYLTGLSPGSVAGPVRKQVALTERVAKFQQLGGEYSNPS